MIKETQGFTIERNCTSGEDIKIISNFEGYVYHILFVKDKDNNTRIFMRDNFSVADHTLTNVISEDFKFNYNFIELQLINIYNNDILNGELDISLIKDLLCEESFSKIEKFINK